MGSPPPVLAGRVFGPQPNDAPHVVCEIGETDLRFRPRDADGPGREIHGIADQMHDAGLHDRLRKDGGDHVWKSCLIPDIDGAKPSPASCLRAHTVWKEFPYFA